MDLTIDLKNYSEGGTVFRRTAARAIVRDGERYLLIAGKYGDHKFPGGGVEPGETLEDALIREVREETGYPVRKSTIRAGYVVHERRRGTTADILEMDSHYFFCEVEPDPGAQDLDDYEAAEGYRVVWLSLPETMEKNRRVEGPGSHPWVTRDNKVMDMLLRESAVLTTRQALIACCMELGGDVMEDYPFQDGNWTVMRHKSNKKGFAFVYQLHDRLQVNVKCSPEWTSFWRGAFDAVTPGYHMNKTHWNTILLDGSVPDRDVEAMLAESYRLTSPKPAGGKRS